MGSLYGKMNQGGNSYGVVPGNGGPRADDKNMNAGPGHVVPAHNTHIAKKVVKALGYEPEVKVDMNQGKKFHGEGQSVPIKISSKEYFLNDEQVSRMKSELNIDPEQLSPDSDYNQRVDGGTTKQVDDMVNQKIGLYGMMNGGGTKRPAYQDGGGTYGFPREFQSALHKNVYGENATPETTKWAANAANNEWGKYLKGESQYQYLDMSPDILSQWDPATGGLVSENAVGTLPTKPLEQIPTNNGIENQVPVDMQGNPITPMPMETAEGIVLPGGETPPAPPAENTLSPYDQALNDQLDRSQNLTDSEKAAQVGMGLWNLSRDFQQLPEPVFVNPSLIKRDYEGMKSDAIGDINRNDRKAMYQARQLGMDPTQLTGITANTQEGTRKINRSIFDMQQADTLHNVQAENVAKDKYAQMKFNRDMTNAQSEAAFADAKGKNIAQNVSEYHDAEEAGLYRDSGLVGAKANREMEADFNEYRSLDKNKMASDQRRVLNSDWNKMSREEKDQLLKIYGSK